MAAWQQQSRTECNSLVNLCQFYDVFKIFKSSVLIRILKVSEVRKSTSNTEHTNRLVILVVMDIADTIWHILTPDIIWHSHYLFIAFHRYSPRYLWCRVRVADTWFLRSLRFFLPGFSSCTSDQQSTCCSHRGEVLSREPQGPPHRDPQDTSRSFWAYAHQLELRLDPAPPIPLSRPARCSTLRKSKKDIKNQNLGQVHVGFENTSRISENEPTVDGDLDGSKFGRLLILGRHMRIRLQSVHRARLPFHHFLAQHGPALLVS